LASASKNNPASKTPHYRLSRLRCSSDIGERRFLNMGQHLQLNVVPLAWRESMPAFLAARGRH
jgi:hypothetical protein